MTRCHEETPFQFYRGVVPSCRRGCDKGAEMKSSAIAVALVGVVAASVLAQSGGNSVAKGSRGFEMRAYYAAPGKLEDLQARFRDHTVKLFEKHGMTNVGYWVPVDEKTGQPSGNTLV